MSLKNKKNNGGFTIIEVLIVLAIAGLILLVVFMAVPALQRNSRNTALKNDVQNVLGGMAEYQSANSGRVPTSVTGADGTVTYAGGTQTTMTIQGSTTVATATAATVPASIPSGTIQTRVGFKCPSTLASGTSLVASARSMVALYSIETSNGTALQCSES